jgi:hypothetical protein
MSLTPEEAKRLEELDFLVAETFASPEEFEEYRLLRRKYMEALPNSCPPWCSGEHKTESTDDSQDLAIRTALNGAL